MRLNRNTALSLFAVALMMVTAIASGQSIPERPDPPRLVNDYAGLLSSQEVSALENKLVAFNDSTSTQIAIVIVDDLGGYVPEEYAQRLGEKWGIGQKSKNNGLVILVKTRTSTRGEVFIKPAYGLEGAVPDLICSEIVDNEILPAFRQEDYYKGLDKATNTIFSLVRGEYTADQYLRKSKQPVKKAAPFGLIAIILFVLIFLIGNGKSNHNNISRGGGLPLWLLLSMLNSGRGSGSGSWGGFSGGGGGGGGFGGFGGGSFGGGGAGGSW
jgi:uncharacterized protein